METKQCTKCGENKPLTKFVKSKTGKNGLYPQCKDCTKKYREGYKQRLKEVSKKYRLENKEEISNTLKRYYKKNIKRYVEYQKSYLKSFEDGRYHVYLLPEEHYCGQTKRLVIRRRQHKQFGKDVEGMLVVGSFNTRKEALQLEAHYHSKGWLGLNKRDLKLQY